MKGDFPDDTDWAQRSERLENGNQDFAIAPLLTLLPNVRKPDICSDGAMTLEPANCFRLFGALNRVLETDAEICLPALQSVLSSSHGMQSFKLFKKFLR